MTSNKNTGFFKVVGNFRSFILSPITAQSEVRGARIARFTEGQKSDDGNPRIYIKRGNLGHQGPRIFLLPGSRLGPENLLHTSIISKEEGGPRATAAAGHHRRWAAASSPGCCPQRPPPLPWPPSAAISPTGCTSPSSSHSPWPCVSSLHRGRGLHK